MSKVNEDDRPAAKPLPKTPHPDHYDDNQRRPSRAEQPTSNGSGLARRPTQDSTSRANRKNVAEDGSSLVQTRRPTQESANRINRKNIPEDAPHSSHTTTLKDSDLRPALEEAYKRIDQLEVDLDDTVAELGSLHSTDQFRLPDDGIARKRDELRYDIRLWSKHFERSAHKTGLAKYLTLITPEECPFLEVSRDFDRYLDGTIDNGPSLLVQAYVWKTLYKDVFGRIVWAGGRCRRAGAKPRNCPIYESIWSLHEVTRKPSKDPSVTKNYHHWRAQTARLVGSNPLHPECVDSHVNSIRKRIATKLGPYATSKEIIGDKEGSKDDLLSIVNEAVALDLLLWQQKAKFEFQTWFPDSGPRQEKPLAFDPSWMMIDLPDVAEEELRRKRAPVNLFCAPALLKFGTTDGNDYRNGNVICKAVVDTLSN